MKSKGFYYVIKYTKAADKYLTKHEDIREKYEEAIKILLTDNSHKNIDVKRIKGKRSNFYRIRIGDTRIIYTVINNQVVVVTTLAAGPKGDIYKKMGGLK